MIALPFSRLLPRLRPRKRAWESESERMETSGSSFNLALDLELLVGTASLPAPAFESRCIYRWKLVSTITHVDVDGTQLTHKHAGELSRCHHPRQRTHGYTVVALVLLLTRGHLAHVCRYTAGGMPGLSGWQKDPNRSIPCLKSERGRKTLMSGSQRLNQVSRGKSFRTYSQL